VVLATGGYTNVFYLSTNAIACNVTATYRAYKRGALFANPCYTQIHPTCIPVSGEHQSKLTLMSESLRNDGRVWVPKKAGDKRPANDIPDADRDYYLERKYGSFGNLAPRDIASRSAKEVCDEGRGVGPGGRGVFLDFAAAIQRDGIGKIKEKYDNLFEMYERITGENGYVQPMRIYPAPHYAMGGLWVDYNLMSNLPGLFVLGEANFSDHGANRLGASALMQGLADGYFIAPYTISNYFAEASKYLGAVNRPAVDHAEFKRSENEVADKLKRLLAAKGKRTANEIHREVGRLMWEKCGMARNEKGLKELLQQLPQYRESFWNEVHVPGTGEELNMSLERAGRVIDFIEFAELLVIDAFNRDESCGGHFREEHQYTEDEVKADPTGKTIKGEAKRNDEKFQFVSAWEYTGAGNQPVLHKEPLVFTEVKPSLRSYK
jgi:succinate dehydrogenase / fumarate reductase flavoprotein subunit